MLMFRKLLIAGVASLGLLAPLAAVPAANAHEFRHENRAEYRHHREHDFRVFYRDPCRPGWTCAGTYCHHREAERCAEQYRCKGFAVFVR
jgi:hypothetical protein